MFRFGYRVIDKLSIEDKAGFQLFVDDEFNTVEHCELDINEEIIDSHYYNISIETKNKIRSILENNKNVFNLNSKIYSRGQYNEIEQMFYFELDNINREIGCNNIFERNIDNNIVKLLIDVFYKIFKELLKEDIILNLDNLIKK